MRWGQAFLFLLSTLVVSSGALQIQVVLNVFSGTRDPSWIIEGETAAAFLQEYNSVLGSLPLASDSSVVRPFPAYRLGYRGYELSILGSNHQGPVAVYNALELESILLKTGREVLSASVVQHVQQEISRVFSLTKGLAIPRAPATAPGVKSADNCTAPVLGSDSTTVFDVSSDCCGFFKSHQSENNCYDYGSDIATNTFAQPGRGSGQKWSENTCEDMRAAAERDGLTWFGTTLPSKPLPTGHYVALLIWPDTNFHWIRMDTNPAGYWSHKPGGTPVTNQDNNGKQITDPSQADFSPWTQFCGYMTVTPSKVNIN